MTTVDPAWISAGSGLLGALVGAGTALAAKFVDTRHERAMESRRQVEDVLMRFWEAIDRGWRTHEATVYTIGEMQIAQEAGNPIEDLEARRQSQLREVAEAGQEARFLAARMRFLGWPIADTADALRIATGWVDLDSRELLLKRDAALAKFQTEATKAIGEAARWGWGRGTKHPN